MAGFSSINRLKRKQEFQFVFNRPYKISNKYLFILFKPNQQSRVKLGVMVGKRYVKRAVDRNQLKRVIRESFRHHKEDLKGLDIVVLIRSECSTLGKKTWRNDINELWQALLVSLKTVHC